MCGTGFATHNVPGYAGADAYLKGIVYGICWDLSVTSNVVTFSFPTASSNYGTGYGFGAGQYPDQAPFSAGFGPLSSVQQDAVRYWLNRVSKFAGITFVEITEKDSVHAQFRYAIAGTTSTAYGNFPTTAVTGGDAFFSSYGYNSYGILSPAPGQLGWWIWGHETGHLFGLKHGDQPFPTIPADKESNEYSVMCYTQSVSYPGSYSLGGFWPMSYMTLDVAGIQLMYGTPGFTNTVEYVFSASGGWTIDGVALPAVWQNVVYMTVAEAPGVTVNLTFSGYSSDLTIITTEEKDTIVGPWSQLAPGQLANTYGSAYAPGCFAIAAGTIVGSVTTGSGNDRIVGNAHGNAVNGGGGTNTYVPFSGNNADFNYINAAGVVTLVDNRVSPAVGKCTLTSIQNIEFQDGTTSVSTLKAQRSRATKI